MINDTILIRYGEIALKGKNRDFFESHLARNMKSQLEKFSPGCFEHIRKTSGGLVVRLTKKGIRDNDNVTAALKHTFGIVNFSFAISVELEIDAMKKACFELLEKMNFETFRISTQRSDKGFGMDSMEIDRSVGEFVFEKFNRTKKVKLKNPEADCHIVILKDSALVFLDKIAGPGGLPLGTGGRAMAMISGGFDSPVAAYQILRRGVQLRFAHFHSMPYTSKQSLEKVKDLVDVLESYGSDGKIFSVPFADVQKEIMMKCPQSLRVIIYRRFMIRIAEALAKKEKCLALVTGDSIGQVASQTMENIFAVNEASDMPIFRPLIGMDKEEIMQKAREIGTYDISKLPHDDCCTRLMPKNPETHARLGSVIMSEKSLEIEKIVADSLSNTTILDK